MSKYKVKLNGTEVRKYLRSENMRQVMGGIAENIAGRLGPDYGSDTRLMPTRQIASVFTDSAETLQDNYKNNTLLKAVGRGVY